MKNNRDQNDALSKSFWNGVAETYYKERYTGRSDSTTFELGRRIKIAESLLYKYGPTSGRSIDFGCGPAVLFDTVTKQGLRYFGIDISEKMIMQGRQMILQRNQVAEPVLMVGNVTDTNLPESYFDVAFALGLINYLDNGEKFYQEVHRVLRKGGVAIISYTNKHSYLQYLRAFLKPVARLVKIEKKVLGRLTLKTFREHLEREKLFSKGFEVLDGVYYDANLIPVNLSLPNCYFRIINALEKVYQKCQFSFGFSGFILVVKKGDVTMED